MGEILSSFGPFLLWALRAACAHLGLLTAATPKGMVSAKETLAHRHRSHMHNPIPTTTNIIPIVEKLFNA